MEEKGKVLIVDDEADIRRLLTIYLKKNGYEVFEAINGETAVEAAKTINGLDLIVLDVMMPGMSGIDACKAIREFSAVPIMFLTAKTQEPVRDDAYNMGGDDFLGKPFSQDEFVRKITALIRRYKVYKGKSDEGMLTEKVGDISVDLLKRVVTKDGEVIKLTDKEYAILAFLITNKGKAWSLETIYENIWGEKYLTSSSNTVMVHILRLRQKIENDPAQPSTIRTVYGKGYQIG